MGSAGAAIQGRQIYLATEDVPPPHCLYLTQDDDLSIVCWSSLAVTLTVTARLIQPDGSLAVNNWSVVLTGNRTTSTTIEPLVEGFLLSVTVTDGGAGLRRGQTYARITLQRGTPTTGVLTQTLSQGYVSLQSSVYWPDHTDEGSYSGFGNIRSITGTTPGIGSEISEAVPTGAIWRLISLKYLFTCSAAVGTRLSTVTFDDGANIFARAPGPQTMAATNNRTLYYGISMPVVVTGFGIDFTAIPQNLYLPAGYHIRTLTGGLDAGDSYASVQYLVEEWLQP